MCHAWVEHFAAFEVPGDCIGCHNQSGEPQR
jgi:hypothetical protein